MNKKIYRKFPFSFGEGDFFKERGLK